METLSKGQALLDRLREASTHADINNQHATKAACYGVERILEALQHRRQQLDEQWREEKPGDREKNPWSKAKNQEQTQPIK